MYGLLDAHFAGITREGFDADLAEKDWVLLLQDGPRLRGFSTLLLYESQDEGGPFSVVYSGDTIVEQAARGTSALAQSWIAAVRTLSEQRPGVPLYWLLITSGFRTYRFLPVFWRVFHPRHDDPMPESVETRLAALASARLGTSYLRDRGIARFPRPQVLRQPLAHVPEGRRRDPHVTFFLERNPGWCQGDELVCFTEIAFENLTRAGQRMWQRGGSAIETCE
jgi:hypothetical protein